jgi:hypothetical protein
MLGLLVATALSLSPQQRADFACLRANAALEAGRASPPRPGPWVRRALRRLKKSDPTRDWMAEAARLPETTTYGEFMDWTVTCQAGARSRPNSGGGL